MLPEEWKESTREADFDLIDDQPRPDGGGGRRRRVEQAEQARLSAYAFFEFGPELQLRALDPAAGRRGRGPGLVRRPRRGGPGRADRRRRLRAASVRETRLALDEALDEARATTGEGASDGTVITNAALIVFREGLEAILIIAAITASMVGANRPLAARRSTAARCWRSPPARCSSWSPSRCSTRSSRYGEKLEAIVGLVAIAVLLLVLNWFFHRVYWTEWIAGHRKRGKALAGARPAAAGAATLLGLYLLGFTSVFREGFETVLFLQALQLSAGTGVVLAGVALGLVADGGGRRRSPSSSSSACPTSGCWSSPAS